MMLISYVFLCVISCIALWNPIQDYHLNCTWYAEVMRVLRPGGLYVFVEHVAEKGLNITFSIHCRNGNQLTWVIAYFVCFYGDTDGTFLKFLQRVLDPLQQTVADGCHLSRETGNNISSAGFSNVELEMAYLSNASFVNPHIYGIAYK